MPSNRFDTSVQQQYVSQYVPMPFEAIGALGAKTQADYDKSLKDLEVTDPIAKLNPRTAMRVYDPSSPEGVRDITLDWTGERDQYLNALTAEKNKITDEYMQSGDVEAFKKKSRDYLNKAAQVHSNLSAKEAVAKQINDYNKELAKNKDFSLQGHLGQKLLDYNTQFLKDAAEGNVREYNPYDIAAATDRPKEVKEYFGSMGKEILQSFSDPTNTGYIRTKYREGLTGDKISNAFNSWYQNSKVQDDIRLEALDFAARKGIDTKSEVTVKVPVSKNAKTGEITYKEEKMPWIDAYEERALNQVKDVALGFKSSTGSDSLKGDDIYKWNVGRREKEEEANIVTTNEQGNPETLNIQNAIDNFGLSDVLDAKGDMITSALGKTGSVTKGGIVTNIKPTKSLKQLALDNATKLVNLSTKLNLGKPEDGDYQKQVYNYITQIAKRASTTSKLQQSTMEGINKAMFGPNSDISNMEFYNQGDESSNAKVTNEAVNSMAKNSRVTGIDYFGPKQAGWKVAVTPKDDSGKNTGVDTPLIGVPRDKGFEEDTRAVHNISRGVLEFAKTGKVNSEYFDKKSGDMLQSMMDANKDKFIGKNVPKIVASSIERNRYGEVVVMGSYLDNSEGVPKFKAVTYYPNRTQNNFIAGSLDEVQANKTTELQTKGALRQYNIKFTETVKPTEVEYPESESE